MIVSREGSFGKTWRGVEDVFKDRKIIGLLHSGKGIWCFTEATAEVKRDGE